MAPSISVIIPAYNCSATIVRAVSSVVNQSVLPNEIIIVDDASPDFDATVSALQIYRGRIDLEIRILRNEVNMNAAASRNRGIRAAKYDLVAFLDSDDEWEPDKLKACLTKLSRLATPAIVYSQVLVIEDGCSAGVRPNRGIRDGEHISENLFLSGGFIQTSTIVCSREIAEEILFDPAFKRHQDYDFCLRAAHAGVSFAFIERPLVRYHSGVGLFSKRVEDADYTLNWGKLMKRYMSQHGYYGFLLFLYCGRLFSQNRIVSAIKCGMFSCVMLGPVGMWRSKEKINHIIKRLINR